MAMQGMMNQLNAPQGLQGFPALQFLLNMGNIGTTLGIATMSLGGYQYMTAQTEAQVKSAKKIMALGLVFFVVGFAGQCAYAWQDIQYENTRPFSCAEAMPLFKQPSAVDAHAPSFTPTCQSYVPVKNADDLLELTTESTGWGVSRTLRISFVDVLAECCDQAKGTCMKVHGRVQSTLLFLQQVGVSAGDKVYWERHPVATITRIKYRLADIDYLYEHEQHKEFFRPLLETGKGRWKELTCTLIAPNHSTLNATFGGLAHSS